MSDDRENSFFSLLISEFISLVRGIFGKTENKEKNDCGWQQEETEPEVTETVSENPSSDTAEEICPAASAETEKISTPSREDKLQALFSGKMQARDRRRQNAVRKADSLHKKYADSPLQEKIDFGDEKDGENGEELPVPSDFMRPSIDIFNRDDERHEVNEAEIKAKREIIQDCLDSFLVDADVGEAVHGPRVTMFKVHVADGVMVNSVTKYEDEIKMRLSAETLRILAPVPGYDYVGIEVPNDKADIVRGGSIMASKTWNSSKAAIPLALGRDISGNDCITDLAKAPHLLVAGTTGSGKSVCLNLLITSLTARFTPDEMRLLLIDPKVVEMQKYNRLPHLMVPVINDIQLVTLALRWLVNEMERRYRILALAGNGIVNIDKYNSRELPLYPVYDDFGEQIPDRLPYIVMVIDELGDIMLTNKQEVETSLARLAQKSRAIGIHTIVATQRPSVDVITGSIKANFPTRIAFKTASQFDSRTILDTKGAENLLGSGDMIFKSNDGFDQKRIQCAMITDQEVEQLVDFWAAQGACPSDFEMIKSGSGQEEESTEENSGSSEANDILRQALEIIITDRRPTVSYLQRRLGIGYNKAATLIEKLEKHGIISPPDSRKNRQILYDSVEEAMASIE